MKIFQLLLIFLLGNCTLSENIQKEESKDYQDTTHNVELVDYEFEERLNSFYDSEPIAYQELQDLYEGEFPEGVSDPEKLRIHWKDARELALAELELQKNIQKWQNADISARPILVLDRDGGDFYRYYEYRVLRGSKFIGAIRIPAYRRTENFATAEVHIYSSDEKTYTVKPTGWGTHLSVKLIEDKDTKFFNSIQSQSTSILTDNFVYNVLYFLYEELGLGEKVTPITTQDAYNQFYAVYDKNRGVMNGAKGAITAEAQDLVIDGAARKNTKKYAADLTRVKEKLFQLESITKLVGTVTPNLSETIQNTSSLNFFMGLSTIYAKMTDNKDDTLMSQTLKDIYWTHLEANTFSNKLDEYLLNHQWNIYQELDIRNIQPIVEYPEYHKYPQKQLIASRQYDFEEYELVTGIEQHSQLITSRSGFVSSDGYKSSLLEPITGADGQEFDINTLPKSNTRTVNKSLNIGDIVKSSGGLESILGDSVVLAQLIDNLIGTISPWIDIYKEHLVDDSGDYSGLNTFHYLMKNGVLETGLNLWGAVISAKHQIINISNQLDKILSQLEQILGKEAMSKIADVLSNLSKIPGLEALGLVSTVINDYVDNGPGFVKKIFLIAFDTWTVWWVPIFIFPTGWWTVDKGNGVLCPPTGYAYYMGLPTIWQFDMSNIVSQLENPTEIAGPKIPEEPTNPELEIVPDRLKPYGEEWLLVHNWLDKNQIYTGFDEDKNHAVYNTLNEDDITDIVNLFMDNVYDLYEGITPVYIDKTYRFDMKTNISINEDESETNTSFVDNVIKDPSKDQKDAQNTSNINYSRKEINNKHGMKLSLY